MKRYTLYASVAATSLLLLACGGSQRPARTETEAGARPSRTSTVIMPDEIATTGAQSVYQAISMLRPHWMRARSASTFGQAAGGAREQVVVYVDEARYGTVAQLQSLPVTTVAEIRFLSASDATTRFGTGHTAGAILIKLK